MKIVVRDSKSPLGFTTKGGGSWEVWDRFITIEGKDAYHIGNICGTCSFFFQRLAGANQSLNPRDFQDQLSSGLTGLTNAQATVLSELLPDGDYEASLLFRIPRLVSPSDTEDYFCREQPALWGIDGFWGLPHDPRTMYYRGTDKPLGDGAHLYEFLSLVSGALHHRRAPQVVRCFAHEATGWVAFDSCSGSRCFLPRAACKADCSTKGRTRRCSEREPADSLRDKSNVIGGWLPSLTFALARNMGRQIQIRLSKPTERALIEHLQERFPQCRIVDRLYPPDWDHQTLRHNEHGLLWLIIDKRTEHVLIESSNQIPNGEWQIRSRAFSCIEWNRGLGPADRGRLYLNTDGHPIWLDISAESGNHVEKMFQTACRWVKKHCKRGDGRHPTWTD